MAKIKPVATIESMSGKVCEHSDMYFRTNKQTGKTVTGKLCNPSDAEPTEAQTKVQTRFTKLAEAARAIMADPEQRAKYEPAYKKQRRVGSLLGFIVKRIKKQYDENGDLIRTLNPIHGQEGMAASGCDVAHGRSSVLAGSVGGKTSVT